MEYTIKKFGELSGVSTRTLRYYDEIDLLKPCRINSSGYRIYGEKEVDLLQQILFYKSLDMRLEEIQKILKNPNFDINKALLDHYNQLISRQEEIERLIKTVEKTIECRRGGIKMSDREKFESFKNNKIIENEEKYGEEIRKKYGEETIEKSYDKFSKLTKEEIDIMNKTEDDMIMSLKELIKNKDLDSSTARKVYEDHRKWLSYTWNKYSKEAHISLVEMYIHDERFAKYYIDKVGEDCVEILRDCIVKYAEV